MFDNDSDGYVTDEKMDEWGTIPSMICPWIVDGGDCNDFDININPEAEELCDGNDNNCNGKIDEGCPAVNKGDALILLESINNPSNYIEDAIKELKKSLGNLYPEGDKKIVWLDTTHLSCRHGSKAFDKEKKAVNKLEKAVQTTETIDAINLIVEADRLLALTAIEEAEDGNAKSKAIAAFNKGENETNNNKKIDKYKKAWKHINKHCEKKSKKSCIEEITLLSPENDTVTMVGDNIGHPKTVFTDVYDNKVVFHTSCSKCIHEGQVKKGWTILEIVDDGTLAQKCS